MRAVREALSGDLDALDEALSWAKRRGDHALSRRLLGMQMRRDDELFEIPEDFSPQYEDGIPLCWDDRVGRLFGIGCAERAVRHAGLSFRSMLGGALIASRGYAQRQIDNPERAQWLCTLYEAEPHYDIGTSSWWALCALQASLHISAHVATFGPAGRTLRAARTRHPDDPAAEYLWQNERVTAYLLGELPLARPSQG